MNDKFFFPGLFNFVPQKPPFV